MVDGSAHLDDSDEVISQFESVPIAVLSDITGTDEVIMDSAIKPIWNIPRVAGSAVTVKAPPNDNYSIHDALTVCGSGDILVIDADSYTKSAVWGEITSSAALEKGMKGTVIDGAVRDAEDIEDLEYPVCALNVNPTTTHKRLPGAINDRITCGGLTVSPGDIVVCDRDGVAVIPEAQAEDILEAALQKIEREEVIINRIQRGESTYEILNLGEKNLE